MFIGKYTQEWYQWGANERVLRINEMQDTYNYHDLMRVQEAQRARRVDASMSEGQAIEAMAEAKLRNVESNITP